MRFLLLAIFVCMTGCCGETYTETGAEVEDVIGTWVYESETFTTTLTIRDDGSYSQQTDDAGSVSNEVGTWAFDGMGITTTGESDGRVVVYSPNRSDYGTMTLFGFDGKQNVTLSKKQ